METTTLTVELAGTHLPAINEQYDVEEVTLELSFAVAGKNLPATRFDPQEYAELEVLEVAVTACDGIPTRVDAATNKNIRTILNMEDIFEAACWEKLDNSANDD